MTNHARDLLGTDALVIPIRPQVANVLSAFSRPGRNVMLEALAAHEFDPVAEAIALYHDPGILRSEKIALLQTMLKYSIPTLRAVQIDANIRSERTPAEIEAEVLSMLGAMIARES